MHLEERRCWTCTFPFWLSLGVFKTIKIYIYICVCVKGEDFKMFTRLVLSHLRVQTQCEKFIHLFTFYLFTSVFSPSGGGSRGVESLKKQWMNE